MPILIFQSSMKRQNVKKKKKGKTHYFFFSFSLFACSTSQVRFFLFAYYCFVCFCCDARGILQLLIAKTLERRAERSSESAGETERARERARERVERFVISAPPSIIHIRRRRRPSSIGKRLHSLASSFFPLLVAFRRSPLAHGPEKTPRSLMGPLSGGVRETREEERPQEIAAAVALSRFEDDACETLPPARSMMIPFPTSAASSSPSPHTASTWPTTVKTTTPTWTPRR